MPIPRTLHFIPFSDATAVGLSGATRSMLTLSTELARRGDVAIVPFHDGFVAAHCRAHGIAPFPVFPAGAPMPRTAVRLTRTALAIRSAAGRFGAQLIHVHSAPGCKYAWLAASSLGLPLVSHQRDTYAPNRFHRGLGLASRIISISHWVHGSLPPRLAAKSVIVHNAVKLPESASVPVRSPGEPLRVGFAGRFSSDKGPDLLVDAASDLLSRHDSIEFHLWGVPEPGEGGEFGRAQRGRLEALAERYPGRVHLKAFQTDIEPFYRRMHVVVVPSRFTEPFGRVAIEGMAYGALVVAAGHGGLPEIIEDGVTGLLFTPGDASALRGAIERAHGDDAERVALASAGLAHVAATFPAERHADAVLDVYRGVLGA